MDGHKVTTFRVSVRFHEFPNVFFADKYIYVSDMTGDGVQDIVHVRSGQSRILAILGCRCLGPTCPSAKRASIASKLET